MRTAPQDSMVFLVYVQDSIRLSGNVLIWDEGELLVRIEADLAKEGVVPIAVSMP